MNSLPQPASGPERRQALETFGILAVLRLDRSCSEDEVAQKLGFGSVEARRIQLKHSGVPEWMLDEAPANERSAVGEDRAHVVRPTCPLCGHMRAYAGICGSALARAHTRSGDRVQIAAYLGASERFDGMIADFAEANGDQTERDHAALRAAVKAGKVAADVGV